MDEELYEYQGEQYTRQDLQAKYGDKTDEAIKKFGFKKIDTYKYQDQTYTRADLESKYGDKTDEAIKKFGFKSTAIPKGVQAKVGTTDSESTLVKPKSSSESQLKAPQGRANTFVSDRKQTMLDQIRAENMRGAGLNQFAVKPTTEQISKPVETVQPTRELYKPKPKEELTHVFSTLKNNYGDVKKYGIDETDFARVLQKTGYDLNDTIKGDEGLYGEYNELAKQQVRDKGLKIYTLNKQKELIEDLKSTTDKKEKEAIKKELEELPNKYKNYYDNELPLLKQLDEDNLRKEQKNYYDAVLNDKKYVNRKYLDNFSMGVLKQTNDIVVSLYDLVGLDEKAEDYRILQEIRERSRGGNVRGYTFANGLKSTLYNRDYILSEDGRIYDTKSEADVTNILSYEDKQKLKKNVTKEEISDFSTLGMISDTSTVLGGLFMQVAGMKGTGALLQNVPKSAIVSSMLSSGVISSASTFNETYNELINAGVNKREAIELSKNASIAQGLVTGLSSAFAPNLVAQKGFGKNIATEVIKAYKSSGKKGVQQFLKNTTKNFISESLPEIGQEILQEGVEMGSQKMINSQINKTLGQEVLSDDVTLKEIIETVALTGMATGVMTLPAVISTQQKYNVYERASADIDGFNKGVDENVKAGFINSIEAEKVKKDVEKFAKHRNNVLNELGDGKKLNQDEFFKVIDILDEVDKIDIKLKNTPEVYHGELRDKKKQLTEQLKSYYGEKTTTKDTEYPRGTKTTEEEGKQGQTKSEKDEVIETLSDAEYLDFVDNDKVSTERLNNIADKLLNDSELTKREQSIYEAKNKEVELLLKQKKDDKENIKGVSSQEQIGQEPITTQPIQETGTETTTTGGDVQTQEEIELEERELLEQEIPIEEELKSNLESEARQTYQKNEEAKLRLQDRKEAGTLNNFLRKNLGRIRPQDFDDFGDTNIRKGDRAFSIQFLDSKAIPLDVKLQELSEIYGQEITPEDVVAYIQDVQANPDDYKLKTLREEAKGEKEFDPADAFKIYNQKKNNQNYIEEIDSLIDKELSEDQARFIKDSIGQYQNLKNEQIKKKSESRKPIQPTKQKREPKTAEDKRNIGVLQTTRIKQRQEIEGLDLTKEEDKTKLNQALTSLEKEIEDLRRKSLQGTDIKFSKKSTTVKPSLTLLSKTLAKIKAVANQSKTGSEVLQEGINILKSSTWYKNLDENQKTEFDKKGFLDILTDVDESLTVGVSEQNITESAINTLSQRFNDIKKGTENQQKLVKDFINETNKILKGLQGLSTAQQEQVRNLAKNLTDRNYDESLDKIDEIFKKGLSKNLKSDIKSLQESLSKVGSLPSQIRDVAKAVVKLDIRYLNDKDLGIYRALLEDFNAAKKSPTKTIKVVEGLKTKEIVISNPDYRMPNLDNSIEIYNKLLETANKNQLENLKQELELSDINLTKEEIGEIMKSDNVDEYLKTLEKKESKKKELKNWLLQRVKYGILGLSKKPLPKVQSEKEKNAFVGVIAKLKQAFPSINVEFYNGDQEATKIINDIQNKDVKFQVQEIKKGDTVYGFFHNGKVYLNTNELNTNTPIHEFGHVFANLLKQQYPKEHQNLINLVKQETGLMNDYRNNPDYKHLKTDDEIADEVFAKLFGDKGETIWKVESKDRESKIRNIIRKFWEKLKQVLGKTYPNATKFKLEDFQNATLDDIIGNITKDVIKGRSIFSPETKSELNEVETLNKIRADFDKKINEESLNERQREAIDVLKNATDKELESLDLQTLKDAVKILDNVLENQDFSGVYNIVSKLKSKKNYNEFKKILGDTFKKNILKGEGLSSILNDISNITVLNKNIFGTSKRAAEFNYLSGLFKLMEGNTKLKKIEKETSERYENLINKIQKSINKNITNAENTIYRAIAGQLVQGSTQEDFKINKSRVEQHIERMKDYDDSATKKMTELMQNTYNDIISKVNNQEDVKKQLEKKNDGNKEVLDFWMNEFSKYAEQLEFNTKYVHNEPFGGFIENYLPIATRKRIGYEAEEDLFKDRPAFMRDGILEPKPTGATIKRTKAKELPNNRTLNLDFDSAIFNSLFRTLEDIHLSEAKKDISNFFDEMVKDKLLSQETYEVLQQKVQENINTYSRISPNQEKTSELVKSVEKAFRLKATLMALGSILQYPKQYFPLYFSGMVRLGKDADLLFIESATPRIGTPELLKMFSISNRAEIQGGTNYLGDKITEAGKRKAFRTIADNVAKPLEWVNTNMANLLFYSLRKGDQNIAETSWIAYYKKYLRDNKYDLKKIDINTEHEFIKNDPIRQKAASFAETMVEETQKESEAGRGSKIFTDPSLAVRLMRGLIFPYQSFNIHSKARTIVDMKNLYRGFKYKDVELLKSASSSFGATLVEQTSFRLMNLYLLSLAKDWGLSQLYDYFEIEEPEDDEESKKRFKFKQLYSDLTKDLNPFAIGVIAENATIETFNFLHYLGSEETQKYWDKYGLSGYAKWSSDAMKKGGEGLPFYRYGDKAGLADILNIGGGMYSSLFETAVEATDEYTLISKENPTLIHDYYGSVYEKEYKLDSNQKKLIKASFIANMLSLTIGMEAETDRMLNKIKRQVVKEAKVSKK